MISNTMTTKIKTRSTVALYLISGLLIMTTGCKPKADAAAEAVVVAEVLELNAHSSYLKKNSVKATIAGHIESLDLNPGDRVEKGQVLLTLKSKEAQALEGYVPSDTSMRFRGISKIKAPKSGVISSVLHQIGDNVMEGDELVVIAEQSSMVFLLEVPYELNQIVSKTKSCKVLLSDNREFDGTISSRLPVMDAQSQTVSYIVNLRGNVSLPENLIAKIRIVKTEKANAPVLPKGAVLANETQSEFWVMKMINDTMAVKVDIKKGLENSDQVEITSPTFLKTDRFLLDGNYGLPDTAIVKIKTLK
jgi:biotin carboxyl carrier protein